jgi:hypothetical protein
VVVSEQLRHLLIELTEVVFDRQQFVERQLHQPPINRMKVRHAPNCNQLRKLSSAASRFFFDGTADPHDAVRVFIGMMASYRGWVKADEDIDCRYRAVAVTRSGTRNTDSRQC